MEISQLILAQLWLYAFFLGAGLGAVYDVLSITRVFLGVPFTPWVEQYASTTRFPLLKKRGSMRRSSVSAVLFLLEDLLFSLGSAISLILLFYQMNNGKVRIPVIVCVLVGFFIYRASLGHLLRPVLEMLALLTVNLIRYTVYFLILPFRTALSAIRYLLLRWYRRRMRKRERKQRIRFTQAELRRLEKNACGML